MKKSALLFLFSFLFISNSFAQFEEDVKSIDSIIKALYASISGDAGVERDWDRFRTCLLKAQG